jgi:hypothetical protein
LRALCVALVLNRPLETLISYLFSLLFFFGLGAIFISVAIMMNGYFNAI